MMGSLPPWDRIEDRSGDGIVTFRLGSWDDFTRFLDEHVFSLDAKQHRFIWRGQRRSEWSLSTSLDRLFERLNPDDPEATAGRHLESFRYTIRGRRGTNPAKLTDDDLWAIGQHYGLATPLLDWTRSPYAAAYFAFEGTGVADPEYRAIIGLNQLAVEYKNIFLDNATAALDFIDPLIDENPRLVSQGGLFTKAPIGIPVERWVQQIFEGGTASPVLIRIEMPNSARPACLRALNQMNINHASLFPDLLGASVAVNLKLELGL